RPVRGLQGPHRRTFVRRGRCDSGTGTTTTTERQPMEFMCYSLKTPGIRHITYTDYKTLCGLPVTESGHTDLGSVSCDECRDIHVGQGGSLEMRTVSLVWREQSEHSAKVNVPHNFDLDSVPYGVLKTLISDLGESYGDTYIDGYEYGFYTSLDHSFDPDAPNLPVQD
ncbi:hypothetical protein ACW9HQ_51895, partial [Nocardia gipuzkoensis]